MKKRILVTLAVFVCLLACIFAICISAANDEPTLEFKAYNLTYGNSVYITYAAYCENLPEGVKPQLLVWDAPQEKYIKGTEKHSAYSYKQDTVKGVICDVFTYDKIIAREMAKDFYAVVYAKVGETEYYSEPAKYSVIQYVYNKLGITGTPSDNEVYKKLLKTTLEYGALAQEYFSEGKDTRLANLPFYQVVTSGGTLSDGFTKGLYLKGDKVILKAYETDANGMVFSHWEDENGKKVSTASSYELTVGTEHMKYSAIYDHPYVATVTPPACVVGGYTTYVCPECGDTYVGDYTDPTGHSMGNWYVSEKVTETSDGKMRSDCLNCDTYETKDIEVLVSGNLGAATGTPSNAITFKLFADGTLRLLGRGKTFKTAWNGANTPYVAYADTITRIIIGEGITGTQGGEFANLHNLETVEFPSTFAVLGGNAFMDSFKKGIDTITIPASVTDIGTYVFGAYQKAFAVFKTVIFENPNTVFYSKDHNFDKIFNGGSCNSDITFYSYGAENNVKAYADKIGAKYIDLDSYVSGSIDNLNYRYFDGEIVFSAIDPSLPAVLPETMPWLAKIAKSDVKSIVIEDGVTGIPANYFKDYTSLETVNIADSVTSIGSGAFSVSSALSCELNLNIPETIESLGSGIFANRTGVYVNAFAGTAADDLKENGVTVNLRKTFKLLLLGNSLSMDAADNSGGGTASQLYNIIKTMLGDNSYVVIGTLYSGAKSATWHATMAEQELEKYQFSVISDDTDGIWKVVSNATTSKEGMLYTDWDYVTIQPYASETHNGIGSMTSDNNYDEAEKDAKFLALSASLPYLLDYINVHAPSAEVYYYLTWATTLDATALNVGASVYDNMINVAVSAMQHKGESGKGFAGLIPAGTAVQNARTTYLALLDYVNGNATDEKLKDAQVGLQRDNVHLSFGIGRYMAALLFAEILIPEELRVDGYVLPNIKDSVGVGELPYEYTEIARLAVEETLKSMKLTTDAKYRPVTLVGYEKDPTTVLAEDVLKMSFSGISAGSVESLKTFLINKISAASAKDIKISVEIDSSLVIGSATTPFSAAVTLSFGYKTYTFTVNGSVSNNTSVTYEEYYNMNEADQLAHYNSFASPADFYAWFNAAKAEYEANQDRVEIGGDGSFDVGAGT